MDISGLIHITLPNSLVGNAPVGTIVTLLIPYVFIIAGLALLFYLVAGGLQIMISQGDPKAIAGGKDKIQNALVGFIIMFVAYWIVKLVGRILGLDVFDRLFGIL
jgi:hypothetical protein